MKEQTVSFGIFFFLIGFIKKSQLIYKERSINLERTVLENIPHTTHLRSCDPPEHRDLVVPLTFPKFVDGQQVDEGV
jgi:hypothetical protein